MHVTLISNQWSGAFTSHFKVLLSVPQQVLCGFIQQYGVQN